MPEPIEAEPGKRTRVYVFSDHELEVVWLTNDGRVVAERTFICPEEPSSE